MSITTIICYCTNDYRFLGKCIEEARHFSDQIIVPVCDHFFNGMPENRELLSWTYAQHPDVQFIEFPYSDTLYPSHLRHTPEDASMYWHALARLMGFYHSKSEWILFLDTDEIVDGKRFLQADFAGIGAALLGCYFYALRPHIRATKVQDLVLLVQRKLLEPKFFYQPYDRYGIYQFIKHRKQGLRGADGRPLIHHYSWVRPEVECEKKVTTWGPRLHNNWDVQELIKGKGLSAFFGMELEFEEIADVYFDPLSVSIPTGPAPPFANVTTLNRQSFLRLEFNL